MVQVSSNEAERARKKSARKHGGGLQRVDLDHVEIAFDTSEDLLLLLDDALEEFQEKDPTAAELVRLRFFVGLTNDQAAPLLGVSSRTAKRSWAYARTGGVYKAQGAGDAGAQLNRAGATKNARQSRDVAALAGRAADREDLIIKNLHSHLVPDRDFALSERPWCTTLSTARKSKFLSVSHWTRIPMSARPVRLPRAIQSAGNGTSEPMRFLDFAIRAWREGPYLQTIAHATPAGSMRQPAATPLGVFSPDDYRLRINASLREAAALGHQLARALFSAEVWRLFGESLQMLGARSHWGIRLRLCLDDDLIDLPWEYLYRSAGSAEITRSGFFLADQRISLVREPAAASATLPADDGAQRGLFLGTLADDRLDIFDVKAEHASLAKALRPVKRWLRLAFAHSAASEVVERAIADGCSVFHYAGHTELVDGRWALVQIVKKAALGQHNAFDPAISMESLGERAPWAWADELALRLARAGTRLAVFNACNSGFWGFVRPFLRAGIPAVIGVQGLVSNRAALNFAEKLYKSLAVGLSLDEALTFARLHVMDPDHSCYDCDWGRFMAYMPTDSAVLFPRTQDKTIRKRQQQMRRARAHTAHHLQALTEKLDGPGLSRMLSEIAGRSVLILGRFTEERRAVLEAIRRALQTPPKEYFPILFTFDKPGERDLIESIVRFAAVSRFVIADLSDPKSVPAELQAIVPQFPSLPVVTIIEGSQREYPALDHILRRGSVSKPVVRYRDVQHLLSIMDEHVLAPAEALYNQLKPAALV